MRLRATIVVAVLTVSAMSLAMVAPVAAYPRPGVTEWISAPPGGRPAGNPAIPFSSQFPSPSSDGRYIAFSSSASDLVDRDINEMTDVFVHDRRTNRKEIVSVASDGTRAVGIPDPHGFIPGSGQPSISGDGRYVAFPSAAVNLVAGDSNLLVDVFVHDRKMRTTERVSIASDGSQANRDAIEPSISLDGRFVVFHSYATNLVAGDSNDRADVFMHDRKTGKTERVSITPEGSQADDDSFCGSLGRGGRYVAFTSWASNLTSTPGGVQVFVRDRKTGTVELISEPIGGPEPKPALQQGSQACAWGGRSISADGRFVVFESHMPDLVPNDSNGVIPGISIEDVFVRDRKTDTTERVSVSSTGQEGDSNSSDSSISPDGRYVSFSSLSVALSSEQPPVGPLNQIWQVFIHDRKVGTTEWISKAVDGGAPTGAFIGSRIPAVSAGGRFVAFQSDAEGFVAGSDSDSLADEIYVRARGLDLGVGELVSAGHAERLSMVETPSFVDTGVAQVPVSNSYALASGGTRGAELSDARIIYRPMERDLFVRLRLTDASHGPTFAAQTAGVTYGLSFRVDGRRYEMRASSLRDPSEPARPAFGLFSCQQAGPAFCRPAGDLTGGFGTTGSEIVASIPLEDLGIEHGSVLSDVVAFSTIVGDRADSSVRRDLGESSAKAPL